MHSTEESWPAEAFVRPGDPKFVYLEKYLEVRVPEYMKQFPKTAKDKEWTGDSADDIADKVSSEGAPKVIPTKGPEDVREKVLVDREKIFSGEKTGKGGFDTTIQEEMANIGRELATRKDFKIPPPLAEQIIDEVRKKYPNSRVSKYNDKKIMTLAKRSSAGAKTMNKLKNKDKWGYNPNQPDGHPVNTTDNIVVRDNLITKLKEAEASGDEESIKHYRKELYFYQKKNTLNQDLALEIYSEKNILNIMQFFLQKVQVEQ